MCAAAVHSNSQPLRTSNPIPWGLSCAKVGQGSGGAVPADTSHLELFSYTLAACLLLLLLQVHSSLEAVERSDFNFPVTFNGMDHTVYVRQRPHLHDFMVRGWVGGWLVSARGRRS